jgi:hypothetical protein
VEDRIIKSNRSCKASCDHFRSFLGSFLGSL